MIWVGIVKYKASREFITKYTEIFATY